MLSVSKSKWVLARGGAGAAGGSHACACVLVMMTLHGSSGAAHLGPSGDVFGKEWVARARLEAKTTAHVGTAQCGSAGGFVRTSHGFTDSTGLHHTGRE